MSIKISPSLLSANIMMLGDEIQNLMDGGANFIHLDMMDNHYVPNLTFGPLLCESITHQFPEVLLDVHIMAKPVDELIVSCAQAGAKRISIHPEATLHLDRSLNLIKNHNCQVGLALNPGTDPACLQWVHQYVNFVLVMTVNPGFGGQTLIPEIIPKITWIKKHYPHLSLCVDGGVHLDNIAQLHAAGADTFIIGSALLKTPDYKKSIQAFHMASTLSRA